MKKFYVLLVTFLFILPVFYSHAQSVDLLWQGDTYTSPFYKGRTLWSSQSEATVLAIPYGLAGSAQNQYYRWTKNGTVLGNISGVGKNTLSFLDSILSKPQTIKVDILSREKVVLATAAVTLNPISPSLLVYENNPLYGFMFHKETKDVHQLKEREITFTAFPFFFSTLNHADGALRYEWRTNSGEVETTNSVTYRTPDNAAGVASVGVKASHRDNMLQTASANFLIQFENLNTGI